MQMRSLGNIPGATNTDQAKEWFRKRRVDAEIPQPVEAFCKSTEFNGILFAKCLSVSQRDQTSAAVRNFGGSSFPKPWANIDQPLDVRTAENTLFAFKRMLVDWGYNASCIRIDKELSTLKVAGTEVIQTAVENHSLKIKWCDGEWENWQELRDKPELTTIQQSAQAKLDRAKAGGSSDDKGKGKGPARK